MAPPIMRLISCVNAVSRDWPSQLVEDRPTKEPRRGPFHGMQPSRGLFAGNAASGLCPSLIVRNIACQDTACRYHDAASFSAGDGRLKCEMVILTLELRSAFYGLLASSWAPEFSCRY